jgi:hypothetical protein
MPFGPQKKSEIKRMLSCATQLVDEQQYGLVQVDCPLVLDIKAGIAPMGSSQPYCFLAVSGYFDSGNNSLIAALEERSMISRNDILVCFIDNQSIVRLRRAVQVAKLWRTRIARAAAIAENFVSTQAKNDG